MTTDESIMTEMLDRATNPSKEQVDELGVQMFCIVVRSNSQLVHKAQEMIVAKVRSTNVTEAHRAIALLEECMTQCGNDFQDEAGKFRFLNELIRLVSKKYQGAETPLVVKQRIMECLLLWTTEFPQRLKIRDAYEMLRKEGDIDHGQTAAALAKRESVLSTIDEAMFAKLIRSKDPENFKRANLLLQYRMAQEARRNDLLAQHRLVLLEVKETIKLLNQMLDTYNPGNPSDVNETIHDLYKSCKKHKPIFQHLPELLGESDAQLIEDTLETNGDLVAIMTRYKQLVPSPIRSTTPASPAAPPAAAGTITTAAAMPAKVAGSSNETLLNELLGDLLLGEDAPAAAATVPATNATTNNNNTNNNNNNNTNKKPNALAELSDIFSSALAEIEDKQQQSSEHFQHAGSGELLEPQVLSPKRSDSNSDAIAMDTRKSGSVRKMPEIDMLSEELFQQVLPTQERMSSFKRDPEKITLNDMARERMHVKPAEDDVPLLSSGLPAAQPPTEKEQQQAQQEEEKEVSVAMALAAPASTALETKHLSEINIELDNIQATGEERVVLDDDDMHLCLNFTKDRPSRHVSVIVISAHNKSRQPVKDFQFEASVKKPCKVRLLPPTDNAMAPLKPFRPASPINQVMLLLNPTGNPVDITCIVGYRLGDDPDPIKESIVAKGIAYVP
ncbi:ADP-ribosylation factor-binding protein GGA3 [Drosophila grimshawi]|uniref:GH24323 n=1 Tax=Drosophila grimshawi TaxID=7222 RepID=B4JMI5_DROGR|nr:ADP-ribosylation factor-binding protein GGA3 [Drosophila grimshawi]EDV91928.1 GH24323 [Drosophila grimshawi]